MKTKELHLLVWLAVDWRDACRLIPQGSPIRQFYRQRMRDYALAWRQVAKFEKITSIISSQLN